MPASTPLPYTTVTRLSAYDMLDSMGTVSRITYQLGGTFPQNIPNRNGEMEMINALKYLGIYHIRNQSLDADPNENQHMGFPDAPSDYENFLTIRNAIPRLKVNVLINFWHNSPWGDGSPSDVKVSLLKLARLGALASIEGPNEPNNQPAFSPTGTLYPQSTSAYNQIWTDWGAEMKRLKNSDPAFANVLLLPPSSAVHGGNAPDGVEGGYTQAAVTDHTAYYDMMNIHSYSAEGIHGLTLGDPQGDITYGNPRNWGCYQVSIANWGRYAMPNKRVIITESGANSDSGSRLSEQAQGLAIVNNYFWAKYYNAFRLYQYQLCDDSTDLSDLNATRWGMYRGDWTRKPAADYVHNFTSVLADTAQSAPANIPNFTVTGPKTSTWGATIAFSKSDGSYVIGCNNVLAWWNPTTGADVTPTAESWTITLPTVSTYTVTDVKTGVTTAPQTGKTVTVAVRGYPMLVRVVPAQTMVILTGGNSWVVPAGVTKLSKVECWGGGGGGAGVLNGAGGNGGGGGAYAAIVDLAVTPSSSIAYEIGLGGVGGGANGSSPGGSGGTTYFRSATTVKAVGGNGGVLTLNTVAAGGAATNCVGTTRFSGGNGAPNTTFGGAYGGAGGASASPSGPGNAGGNDATGVGGGSPTAGAGGNPNPNGLSDDDGGGGGGAGAAASRSGTGGAPGGGGGGDGSNIADGGGAGGRGQIRITYFA